MERLWCLPLLLITMIVSIAFSARLDIACGMDGDALLILGAAGVFYLAALITGCLFKAPTFKSIVIVTLIAFTPIAILATIAWQDKYHHRYVLPVRKFSRYLGNPSVAEDIRFVSSADRIGCDAYIMLSFSISPSELDKLISRCAFVEIDKTQFRRPDDLFTHDVYLPMGGNESFYQRMDEIGASEFEYGVDTLKVSSDRKRVIYRREREFYYTNKEWEQPGRRRQEIQDLRWLRTRASKK